MSPFHQADPSASPAASPAAPGTISTRLDRLIGDPLRQDLRDPDFMDFVGRQFDRAFPGPVRRDATGRQIDSPPEIDDLEPFRPAVARSDLELGAGVGPRQKNRLSDLVGVKKALAKTGFLAFDVTEEPSDKAGPLFQAALGRFQREHGLKVDAVAEPKGPTVKALRKAVFEEGGAGDSHKEEVVDVPERQRAQGDNTARPQLAQANSAAEPDVVWPQSPVTNEYRLKVSDRESKHDYSAISDDGVALGRYQLRPLFLIDAGFKKKNKSGQIVWDPKSGITSDQDFFNDPKAQERALANGLAAMRQQLKNFGSLAKIGTEIDGKVRKIKITEAGLVAAAQRRGAPTVRDYLEHQEQNGWKSDFSMLRKKKAEAFDQIETRLRQFEFAPFAN